MHRALGPYLAASVAIAGASLITVPSAAPSLPDVQVREIQLLDVDTADSPLGDPPTPSWL
jgi:hypothetical protein